MLILHEIDRERRLIGTQDSVRKRSSRERENARTRERENARDDIGHASAQACRQPWGGGGTGEEAYN
jgi:hypothetical protein